MSKVENGEDRGSIELPDGVYRGADYFKQTVGARRERSAAKLRASFPEDKADLVIINLSHEKYLELPPIAKREFEGTPVWMPRYDETGSLYTNKWIMPETKIVDDRRFLPKPEKYKILRIPAFRKQVDLTSIPKKWTIIRLVPQEIEGGIEAALRQQDEIMHDYGIEPGPEQAAIEELMVNINIISEIFTRKRITFTQLNEIGDQVGNILEAHGLGSATDETKIRINSSTHKALNEDSIGRINPLVARTYLASAYLDAVRREVVNRLVREKASNVFGVLFLDRAITRANLQNAISAFDALGGFEKELGSEMFVYPGKFRDRSTLPDNRITQTRNVLAKIVNKTLDKVKVAPYLLPANLAKFFIMSMSSLKKSERVRLGKILEVGGFKFNYDRKRDLTVVGESGLPFFPVDYYIRKRDMQGARGRLWIARQILAACLEDEDNKVYTVF